MAITVTLKGGPADGMTLKLANAATLDFPMVSLLAKRDARGNIAFDRVRYSQENNWTAERITPEGVVQSLD